MTRRARCLGDLVGDYVAGRLPDQATWDRHLITCLGCRGAVDLERRVMAVLRSAPEIPGDLRSMLLSVSSEIPVAAPRRPRGGVPTVPPVPAGPGVGSGMGVPRPLAVLSPSAPPQHRSALRAAVFAGAAVGASAAAVWAISVTPVGPTVRPGPASLVPAPATVDARFTGPAQPGLREGTTSRIRMTPAIGAQSSP